METYLKQTKTSASVIGFFSGSDHLSLMKQHLANIEEMPWGKSSLSGNLSFQRAKMRLRNCQNLLSLVLCFSYTS